MESDNKKERFISFAVAQDDETADASLDELAELADTAGGEIVARMIQHLPHPDPVTYLGKGKVQELREMMDALEADAVICDDELAPSQHRNLADLLDAKVVDRTMLILDIFAGRATTSEGKIQVEMAQLKYRATRLTGKGTALSRLGGGIGTRGPGETKLETDRRVIQKRIARLSSEIRSMKTVRETTRKKRSRSPVPTAAIIGYTNAGKSTLLNRLTGAGILAEDKLFATLDPTTRAFVLPGGMKVLLTDTVGFINKLPHHLVDAFRSTLEEARYADLILHVVDISSSEAEMHRDVVYETLDELGVKDIPVITVLNKEDLLSAEEIGTRKLLFRDSRAEDVIPISCVTDAGLEELFGAIENVLQRNGTYIEELIPYSDAARLVRIRRYGRVISEEYTDEGTLIKAFVPAGIR